MLIFPIESFSNSAQVTFAGVPTVSNTVVAQKSFEANAVEHPTEPTTKVKRGKKNGAKLT